MKILLPVDGSDYTRRMLDYLAAHGDLFGSERDFVVLTVVAPIPPHVTHHVSRDAIEDYHRSQADAVLEPVRAFARQQGWKVRASHAAGHAAEAICAFAGQEHPDLIVMGSHGHTALGGLVVGSVTTGVLAGCKVPVLLVR